MKDNLFDSEQKRSSAITALTGLLQHPGWKLMEEVLEANIEYLRNLLEEGLDIEEREETKEDIDLLRAKILIYRETKNKPQDIIEKLQKSEDTTPNIDPYHTVESLKKARNKEI